MKKRVIIVGATGLVGNHLTHFLLDDNDVAEVVVLTRRALGIKHVKLHQVVTDFRDPSLLQSEIFGDGLFCCLGTTMKKAKTKAAFEWVDLDLPVMLGNIAKKNNIPAYLLVTSLGANPRSKIFYNRTKGKVEEAIQSLNFETCIIFRPSMLMGQRNEKRMAESIGQWIMQRTQWLMTGKLRKYRPIEGKQVAKATVYYYKKMDVGHRLVLSDEMMKLN